MSIFSFQFLETGSAALLVGSVLLVGVLHTLVPDHWVPITLIARQRGWSKRETAHAALKAGSGHVITTLILAAIVWLAGVAVADTFGHWIDTVSSGALMIFGCWIAISSWRDMRSGDGHGHSHGAHGHAHDVSHLDNHANADAAIHGPELQTIRTAHGEHLLSIHEWKQPPRFRFTADQPGTVSAVALETVRDNGSRQSFTMTQRDTHWESLEEIPEPHGFTVDLIVTRHARDALYRTGFAEHTHEHAASHAQPGGKAKTSTRTALLLILGSSPMIEGIPAFFAAGKYGPGLIAVMALVFAVSTILTYVLLCVYSTAGLQRVKFGTLERYGEVFSGAFIALVGLAFWMFPML
ncbi:hypothetical protein [Janthinobacterium sp.]|uniref:hypothetical protein n=1 Tax=Janthinobacterium sp. TaxID=1871054 RepID=UPI0026068C97|nr:hypothetical protein [Janthinobacterium sp.]